MELNREVAKKVLSVVDAGIVSGMGEPTPGKMCVEAAVCFALGLPHSDNPPCVGESVRLFKIGLNDQNWSSDEARAKGMRRIAIAQLGSTEIDQKEFLSLVGIGVVQQIVPVALRAAGKMSPAEHAEALESCAVACEAATDLPSTRAAASAAAAAADAAYAAAYAADAADAAAYAAAYAAADAADAAAADAAYAADAAAYAAADAADADAADAAAKRAAWRDRMFGVLADIATNALIKLGSQGTQWLDLCE